MATKTINKTERRRLAKRAKELDVTLTAGRYEYGYIAQQVAPKGDSNAPNGSTDELEAFIEEEGLDIELVTLRRYRDVVHAWESSRPEGVVAPHGVTPPPLSWELLRELATEQHADVRWDLAMSKPKDYLAKLVQAGERCQKGVDEAIGKAQKGDARWTKRLVRFAVGMKSGDGVEPCVGGGIACRLHRPRGAAARRASTASPRSNGSDGHAPSTPDERAAAAHEEDVDAAASTSQAEAKRDHDALHSPVMVDFKAVNSAARELTNATAQVKSALKTLDKYDASTLKEMGGLVGSTTEGIGNTISRLKLHVEALHDWYLEGPISDQAEEFLRQQSNPPEETG